MTVSFICFYQTYRLRFGDLKAIEHFCLG